MIQKMISHLVQDGEVRISRSNEIRVQAVQFQLGIDRFRGRQSGLRYHLTSENTPRPCASSDEQ